MLTSCAQHRSGRRFGYRPPQRDDHLRVSDAERAEVVEELTKHFADGRLDQQEFDERVDQAMHAKTRADLSGLFDDLPHLRQERPEPVRRRRHGALLLIALLVLAAATVPPLLVHHVPWLFIALLVFVWWRVGHRQRS